MNDNRINGHVEMTDEDIGILIDSIDAQIFRLNNLKEHFKASFSETDNKIIDNRIKRMNDYKKKFEACLSTANSGDEDNSINEKKYSEYEKELKEIFNKETFGIDYDLYDLSEPSFISKEDLDKVIKFLTGPNAQVNTFTAQARIEKFKDVYLMKYGSIVYGLINDILRKEMA